MKIIWEVEDGYVGPSRPQRTEIYLSDFEDDMTDTDIENMIYDAVKEDFEQKISYFIQNMSDVVEYIKTKRGVE